VTTPAGASSLTARSEMADPPAPTALDTMQQPLPI
jgi:hypothetical protein